MPSNMKHMLTNLSWEKVTCLSALIKEEMLTWKGILPTSCIKQFGDLSALHYKQTWAF